MCDSFTYDEMLSCACYVCNGLYYRFYRFMARFSGRRRACCVGGGDEYAHVSVEDSPQCSCPTTRDFYTSPSSLRHTPFPISPPALALAIFLLLSSLFRISESCSSRSTPKPRPPSPSVRPNITFQTYACPSAYAAWYCLNGATCFAVKIGESLLYNCECADGYMGQRCEFKDLDGSYLPSREKVMLETASIAGGATVAVLLVVILFTAFYTCYKRRQKEKSLTSSMSAIVSGFSHHMSVHGQYHYNPPSITAVMVLTPRLTPPPPPDAAYSARSLSHERGLDLTRCKIDPGSDIR